MEFQTVSDLKTYLSGRNVSPEQLAKETNVSNMTIRRLLRKDGATLIPKKYSFLFEHFARSQVLFGAPLINVQTGLRGSLAGSQEGSFAPLLAELEKIGQTTRDLKRLDADLKLKLSDARIDKVLRSHVKTLTRALRSPKCSMKKKAVCVGALLYLISPLDLIPDSIPVVGYLDDFAVLSLAVATLAQKDDEKTPKAGVNEV